MWGTERKFLLNGLYFQRALMVYNRDEKATDGGSEIHCGCQPELGTSAPSGGAGPQEPGTRCFTFSLGTHSAHRQIHDLDPCHGPR